MSGFIQRLRDTQQLKSSKILVIGESCIDTYVYGTCDRISPEAPVPVFLEIGHSLTTSGMACNVYNNLLQLRQSASLLTSHDSIFKTRYVDSRSGQQLLRVDRNDTCEEFLFDSFSWKKEEFKPEAIVISDYNKGFLSLDAISAIIQECSDIPVFIDSKKTNITSVCDKNNVILKLNQTEFNLLSVKPSICSVVVTLGSKGATINDKIFSAKASNVFDVCGAGDSFIAGLASAYMHCRDIEDSVAFANVVAGISVEYRGTYKVSIQEVYDRIK